MYLFYIAKLSISSIQVLVIEPRGFVWTNELIKQKVVEKL